MWKKSIIAGIVALACGLPLPAHSGEYDDYDDAHPLRIIAYPLHAVGYGLERFITRPLHRLVSRPALAPVFGHGQDAFSFERRSTDPPPSHGPSTPHALPGPGGDTGEPASGYSPARGSGWFRWSR